MVLTSLCLRHRIPPNIQKTPTRTSTLQSGFQRARQTWCEPGKSAEAEWPSELNGRKPSK